LGEFFLKKLDTLQKFHIFITKQIKTQMKNLHIITLLGADLEAGDITMVMV